MKKLLVFALFFSVTAQAGGMSEIVLLTDESIFTELGLIGGLEDRIEVVSREFTTVESGQDLAVKTQVLMVTTPAVSTQEWTCVTQFVKTLEFFEVSKTDCNASRTAEAQTN